MDQFWFGKKKQWDDQRGQGNGKSLAFYVLRVCFRPTQYNAVHFIGDIVPLKGHRRLGEEFLVFNVNLDNLTKQLLASVSVTKIA